MNKPHDIFPRFPVSIAPATDAGALYPVLDDEELELQSPIMDDLEFPFGGNIDALLIFDIDPSYVVGNVEILVPMSRWEHSNRKVPSPTSTRGVLSVPQVRGEIMVDDITPKFLWNSADSQLLIEVEPETDTTRWVALSDRCHVLVNDGFLAGFVVQL